MMSKEEDLESWAEYDSAITKDTDNLKLIIDSSLDEGYFNEKELTEIQKEMGSLIKQIEFWMVKNNAKRFSYDLRQFLIWLCDYAEEKENE